MNAGELLRLNNDIVLKLTVTDEADVDMPQRPSAIEDLRPSMIAEPSPRTYGHTIDPLFVRVIVVSRGYETGFNVDPGMR